MEGDHGEVASGSGGTATDGVVRAGLEATGGPSLIYGSGRVEQAMRRFHQEELRADPIPQRPAAVVGDANYSLR